MKCKLNIQLIFKTLSYFYWCIKCIGTGYLNSIQVPNLLPCQLFPSFFKTSLQLSQQIPWNEIKLKQIEWNSKTKLTLPSKALAYIHITLHIALHSTTYIPVKWGDIFVARNFSSTLLNVVGFRRRQMKTSDSWPRSTVDLLAGISTPVSSSQPSLNSWRENK
jgi:hypothetical protein